MDIDAWLRGIGLGQYAQTFRDNAIDADVLRDLTDEHLRELGLPLGVRLKLLRAVAALGTSKQTLASPEITPPASRGEAERRQVTVMFSDLVGSTALSARMDPEDLREIISAYQKCVAETVARFGGFVAKYMGDGVLIYFGYPQAHEDDAERAVRAGLELITAVEALKSSVSLQIRVGIATGLVVVGDLIGAGEAQERGIAGETPNLAARLQGIAEPNMVVIAESTRKLLGNLFDLEELAAKDLKGIAGPVRAWAALRARSVESRFEALRTVTMPLVGRDEEIELLLRRWSRAKSGEGQVMLLSGEAGIGKSRLTAALLERLATEPHTRLRYFCSPQHTDSALFPVIAQLERAAEFGREDSLAAKRNKLAALLVASGAPDGDLSLLSDLLWLPDAAAAPISELPPQRKKELTFDALLGLLERLSRRQPVLMVFEDLHWIDPTSRELLDRTVALAERAPILLVATFRPEFQAPWIGQADVTLLALNRLGHRDGAVLVRQLAGNARSIAAEIVDEIVQRSDGVPLFLEEVTKVVIEAAAQDTALGMIATISTANVAVPATLQASLMARLDRLGTACRETAQTGSAIGRSFSYELLAAVWSRSEVDMREALDRLVEAGLVFQHGTPPAAEYQFKHALVQDTAYGTLLRGPRQTLHARIAQVLMASKGKTPPAAPEIVAHHLQNARRSAEAIVYWREAGQQAVRRAAHREATGHFRRALSLVSEQQKTAENSRIELAILSQLGPALMTVHGWSAPEVGEVVEQAAEVGRRLQSSIDLAPAIANLWIFNTARGRHDRAAEISADVFRIAQELGDPEIMLQAHHCAWATNFFRGRFAEAGEHIDAGAVLYDEVRHAHHRHVYLGHDPGVCILNFGACLQTTLGYPVRGIGLADEGIVLARRLGHAPSLANALWRSCEVSAFRSDPRAVMSDVQELLSLTEIHGLPMPRAYALIFLGWALSHSGQATEGIARLYEGREMLTRMGSKVQLTFHLGLIAESLLVVRRYSKGLEQVAHALDLVAETGENFCHAHLHRVRAELLLHAHGSTDPAVEANLRQAIAVAQRQGAKGWELAAATRLARLWGEEGRRAEARELLAPIYGWFTEGHDTPDLKQAKALLDELCA